MVAYIPSQREQRGSAELCSLVMVTGTKGVAWSCVDGGLVWVLGEGLQQRVDGLMGTRTGCPGQWVWWL